MVENVPLGAGTCTVTVVTVCGPSLPYGPGPEAAPSPEGASCVEAPSCGAAEPSLGPVGAAESPVEEEASWPESPPSEPDEGPPPSLRDAPTGSVWDAVPQPD